MRRSPVLLITVCLAAVCGCASRTTKPAPPVVLTRGSLQIVSGVTLAAAVTLPAEFEPDPRFPPIWLEHGGEIGIAGRAYGKSVLLGLGGPQYTNQRVIAADFNAGAPSGRLLDFAASVDGLQIATAVADASQNLVEIMLIKANGTKDARTLAMIAGTAKSAHLSWLDDTTIAFIFKSGPRTEADAGSDPGAGSSLSVNPEDTSGLYLINVMSSQAGARRLDAIRCAFSALRFSPNRKFAVDEGGDGAAPALIKLEDQSCHPIGGPKSLEVLGWAPDSSAFIYAARGKDLVPGTFRYDLASGRSAVLAIASAAAAYASDGTTISLGNSELSWERASAFPDKPLNLEIALANAGTQEITVNATGLAATPRMMAQSHLVFSKASDDGLIDIGISDGSVTRRGLIEYSYPARAAFPIASVAEGAPIAISWAPDGKSFVVLDCGVHPSLLTAIAPAR
jgi:hypothetical protein